MKTTVLRTISSLNLLLMGVVALSACRRAEPRENTSTAPAEQTTPAATTPAPAETAPKPVVAVGNLTTCAPSENLNATLDKLTQFADADQNGEISRDEARSGADFLVGGFFFRADSNADGQISPEEGRAIRAEVANRYPSAASLLRHAAEPQARQALERLGSLLGVDYGQSVRSGELRDAAHRAIDEVFRLVDGNSDQSISRAEAQAASLQGVRSLGHAVFAKVDTGGDGKVSLSEFEAALDAPTRAAFQASDKNNDGQLTELEAHGVAQQVMQRLWLPQGPTGNVR